VNGKKSAVEWSDSMEMKFENYKTEIENFCAENGLSFEKLKTMIPGWNSVTMSFSYCDDTLLESADGLNNDTPLPVVLWIKKVGDILNFEKTEFTQKFLAI
jgi:hypothetical protein